MDFISWNNSARSRALAEHINADYHLFSPNYSFLLRQSLCLLWTIKLFLKKSPRIIFIQHSFLLLFLIVFYKKISKRKIKIIVDCHTKALSRVPPKIFSPIFIRVKNYLFENVDHTFVHNSELLSLAESICKSSSVLVDPIPRITINNDFFIHTAKPVVTFVCSFDTDEPIDLIADAAKELSTDSQVYITGKPTSDIIERLKQTTVITTGYLKRAEYLSLLCQSTVIVGLTTEQCCLQSSGYEALALGKAFVTSNTVSLKNLFGDAAIYTNNQRQDLIYSIRKCSKLHKTYNQKMQIKAINVKEAFEHQIATLWRILKEDNYEQN